MIEAMSKEYNGYAVVIERHRDCDTSINVVCATKDENLAYDEVKKAIDNELDFIEKHGITYQEFDYTDCELNGVVLIGCECENSVHIYIKRTNVI